MREKESLECVRMHIWALKTQKLPGPLSRPWTPAAYCLLRSRDSASLRRQLSAAEAGAPPLTKSWIRTCFYWNIHTVSYNCSCHIANIIKVSLMKTLCTLTDEIWFTVSINGSNLSCDKHEEANSHNDNWRKNSNYLIICFQSYVKMYVNISSSGIILWPPLRDNICVLYHYNNCPQMMALSLNEKL